MATIGSFVDVRVNPCYDDPTETTTEEKHPILSDQADEIKYTEDDSFERNDIPHDVIRPKIKSNNSTLNHISLVIIELLGLCCLAAIICWVYFYHNGFSWDGGKREFNFHPVFMVAGMIFCYANAAISSYVLRNHSESCIHYLHCIALLLIFIFTVLGMASAVDITKDLNITFYSFHSWLGVITMFMFLCQVIVGFIGLFPKCEDITRKLYLKFQIWIALVVFILSITTCLLGISEKRTLHNASNSKSFNYEGVLANVCCLFLVLFGFVVSCALLHPKYRHI